MNQHIQLQVLVFPTRDGMVAQCVSFDFSAQGPTVGEAIQRFQKALVGQVIADLMDNKIPFSECKPTPPRYVLMFNKAMFRSGAWPIPIPPDLPSRLKAKGKPMALPSSIQDVRIY